MKKLSYIPLATAAILLAVDRTLARKAPLAVALLLLALVVHPIMAAFGISFCIFLMLVFSDRFSWGPGPNNSELERFPNCPMYILT